jgi:hypothetical protein
VAILKTSSAKRSPLWTGRAPQTHPCSRRSGGLQYVARGCEGGKDIEDRLTAEQKVMLQSIFEDAVRKQTRAYPGHRKQELLRLAVFRSPRQ